MRLVGVPINDVFDCIREVKDDFVPTPVSSQPVDLNVTTSSTTTADEFAEIRLLRLARASPFPLV